MRSIRIAIATILLATMAGHGQAQETFPLAGVWNCQGATLRSQIVFQQTGQYSAQAVSAQGYNITHWGTWRMVGPRLARLYLQGWSPREYMGNPIRMPTEDNFAFQPVNDNRIMTADGSFCVRAG
jgi:hypothetical protein